MSDWPNPNNVVVPKDDTASAAKPVCLIGDVAATLLVREEPIEPVMYTGYPVEQGEEFSDYAIDLPKVLVLDLVFYSDPVQAGLNRSSVQSSVGRRLTTWQQKRDAIRDYKDKRTEIEVFTGYDVYPNRRIENIDLTRTPETAHGWSVSITFAHTRYVGQEWVSVPYDQIPKAYQSDEASKGSKKGAQRKNHGGKPAAVVEAKKQADLKSELRGLLGG